MPPTTTVLPATTLPAATAADLATVGLGAVMGVAARRAMVRAALRPDGSLPATEAARLAAVAGCAETAIRRDQRELRAALGLPPQVRGPHAARARALAHFLGRAVVEGEGEAGDGGAGGRGGRTGSRSATQTPPSLVGDEVLVLEGARACESDGDSTVLDAPFEPGELQACVQRLIRRSLTVMEVTLRDGRGDRTAVELAKWVMTDGREALTVSEADPKAMEQLAALLNMVKE